MVDTFASYVSNNSSLSLCVFSIRLKDRGVAWKTERDGRVFPVSDTSQTIIQCIQQQLLRYNVQVRLLCCVTGIERDNDGHFRIHIGGGKHQASISSRYVLVSTGSNRLAYRWIASLGHVKDTSSSFLCPSLFTVRHRVFCRTIIFMRMCLVLYR